jgi:hypothetical protein
MSPPTDQDRKCYGVGGGGCSDKNGAYACTSKSDYSSCHCPANNQDDDSDDSYDCAGRCHDASLPRSRHCAPPPC